MQQVWRWLVKVFWPVLEPIIRWGLRLGFLGCFIWFFFYSSYGEPVRTTAESAIIRVYDDLTASIKSNEASGTVESRKITDKRLDPCLKRANSSHTSCLLGAWGKSSEQNACEVTRLQQIDRCEDRYGG